VQSVGHCSLQYTTVLHSARPCASVVCAAGSVGNEAFREGLVSGFLLILFSELGDKTFFIAVLLALKKNKGLVFAGTFGALAVMTVISVGLCTLLFQALCCVTHLPGSSFMPGFEASLASLVVATSPCAEGKCLSIGDTLVMLHVPEGLLQ